MTRHPDTFEHFEVTAFNLVQEVGFDAAEGEAMIALYHNGADYPFWLKVQREVRALRLRHHEASLPPILSGSLL